MPLACTSQATSPLPLGWSAVRLHKRNEKGHLVTAFRNPIVFDYHLDEATGDLYGLQAGEGGADSPCKLSLKSGVIFLCAVPYAFGMMGAAVIRLCYKVSSIFWKTFPSLVHQLRHQGVVTSLANATMQISVEIPIDCVTEIWRIVRSPLYCVGIMVASIVGLISPLEGRKWLGKLETDWHEGLSYAQDMRYRKSSAAYDAIKLTEHLAEIAEGKIFLLGYCMAKRGNLSDLAAGKRRFERVENYVPSKPNQRAQSGGLFRQLFNRK